MAFPRSGTVDTQTLSGTKDFVLARNGATQSTNIAANDHVKFDTVDMSRGSSIVLDTTTTYSNSNGAASLGRFSLQGGKVYKLTSSIGYVLGSGATGLLSVRWTDVTGAPVAIGSLSNNYVMTDATNETGDGNLFTMFAPGGSSQDIFLVELRIITATALTSFGDPTKGAIVAMVETY